MDKQKEQTIPVEGTVTKAEEKKGLFAWIKAHPVKTGMSSCARLPSPLTTTAIPT